LLDRQVFALEAGRIVPHDFLELFLSDFVFVDDERRQMNCVRCFVLRRFRSHLKFPGGNQNHSFTLSEYLRGRRQSQRGEDNPNDSPP
jgi:hypothetical protein